MEEQNSVNVENEIEVSVDEEVDQATNGQEENVEEFLDKNLDTSVSEKQRFVRLPLARVKNIIKTDPDCGIVSQDSVFLITKATELFLSYVSQHIAEEVSNAKRKTVMRKDIDAVVRNVPNLCFLDGALE